MRITLEIDDDELRRVIGPVVQRMPTREAQDEATPGRLLNVLEVAERLGTSRSKVYELLRSEAIQSIAIGRSRRVSTTALSEFMSNLADYTREQSPMKTGRTTVRAVVPSQVRVAQRSASGDTIALALPRRRKKSVAQAIDLSPKPRTLRASDVPDEDWPEFLVSLGKHGWLPEIVEQINLDRQQNLSRTYVLTIDGAAQYLGVSRYAVNKLIEDGKLRLMKLGRVNTGEKLQNCIPATDVQMLK